MVLFARNVLLIGAFWAFLALLNADLWQFFLGAGSATWAWAGVLRKSKDRNE